MRFKVTFVLNVAPNDQATDESVRLWVQHNLAGVEVSQLEVIKDDSPVVPEDCPF